MIDDFKGSIKGISDNIPYITALGIILGTGAHSTVFGALIISFIFLLFKFDKPLIFSISAVLTASLTSSIILLKGSLEKLWAILFLAGLITVIISLLKTPKKFILSIPKSVSQGFITGALTSILILTVPLILGQKGYISLPLLIASKHNFFNYINEGAVICSIATFVIYHYLSKSNLKFLPKSLISVIIPIFINIFYKTDLILSADRIEYFKPAGQSADFGNLIYVLLFAILISIVIFIQTSANLRGLKIKNQKEINKVLLIEGISNTISALTGTVSGVVSYNAAKDTIKLNPLISGLICFIILLIFSIFFKQTIGLIPVCSISSILFIKLYEVIKFNLHSQKIKNKNAKIIFIICFVLTFLHTVTGLIASIILTFLINTKNKNLNKLQ